MIARCLNCGSELLAGAKFCAACGNAVSSDPAEHRDSADRDFAGERKLVTVLFADFAGFTAFSEKRDIEEVHDFMQSLWSRLDAIITGHGGSIEKHIGDAIMSVFGARQAREADPEQAVRAALAMHACLRQPAGETPTPGLQMRIGIHTGSVVVGPTGADGHFTTTGDTVNLASRLEEIAPIGGVLISQATYRQVYGLFDVRTLPPLAVKGRSEPIQTYEVLRARSRSLARTLRGIEGVANPMVGREQELTQLQSALFNVMSTCVVQVVTVVGEAGIGKSCLLREFRKWVEMLPQVVRFFLGRAAEGDTGLPFSLMREVFCSRFDILESDPPAVAREKLQGGLLALLGGGAQETNEDGLLQAHFIGQLLGLDFSASPLLQDTLHDPEQIRYRAFDSLGRFFARVSKDPAANDQESGVKALLLVLDDIHWADDGSLDLLAHIAGACRAVPLMILCLARPTHYERHPRWGQAMPRHTRVDLHPLSRPESHALLETILGRTHAISKSLEEQIVDGAEGNPFFIEEIVKMFIEQKVILTEPSHARLEPERSAATWVPPTLTAVLQARLDQLTTLERAVLQRASVIGRVFWDTAVERLARGNDGKTGPRPRALEGMPLRETATALAGLRGKQLIFRRESSAFAGSVEYTFNHELLRNVAYETLLKKLRRRYHAEVATWLIEQSGERVSEFAGSVAAHFEQAGQATTAAEWYGRAGRQARTGYSPAIAIEHFRKALELSSDLPAVPAKTTPNQKRRLEWFEGLGETLGAQARFVESMAAYSEMCRLAEAVANPVAQATACNGLAFLHERQGDNRASIEAAQQAEQLARTARDEGREARVRALYLKGWALYRLAQAPDVLALAEQIQQLCTESQDRRGLANSFKLHGVAHLQLGHYAEADQFFTRGLALSQELGERRNAAAMLSNLGESARLRGDYSLAAQLYQKALDLARLIGHRESEVIYLSNLAGARLGLGQFEEAEADLRQVLALAGDPNSPTLSEAYTFLAETCLNQGKLEEALTLAQHAVTLAQASENHLLAGGAWRVLGQAAAEIRQRPSALGPLLLQPRECFEESLRVLEQIDARGEQARTLLAWAHLEQAQGHFEAARQKSGAAQSLLSQLTAGNR